MIHFHLGENDDISHTYETIDPIRDIEVIETELLVNSVFGAPYEICTYYSSKEVESLMPPSKCLS